jgi:hypothetical protein
VISRRRVLGVLGGLAGAGLMGRYALLPPSRSSELEPPDVLARRFFDSLSADDRRRACVAYDHPLRQYHNRGIWGGGVWVQPLSLGWDQRRMLTDLLHAGLSEAGRARVPEEYYTRWPGVHSMHVLLCGDPSNPPYQLILTGAHLNLRIGGRSREGAAFGGPLVYGDQRGDSRPGLPGNLYRFQLETAQRLFLSLSPEQQRLAVKETSPVQTDIQLQGSEGSFAGVQVSGLAPESRAIAREMVGAMLSTYPADDVAYAWSCLERNGGVEGLHLAYYQDSAMEGSRQLHNIRLEGPAAVFYFRGFPHVHAFVNVGLDPDAPLSVGERLADNPTMLEGAGVKRLFEAALREHLGADFGYYDIDSVAGRLRRGPVRTGDIYALESWQDRVVRVEVRGSKLSRHFVDELRTRGIAPEAHRVYAIATTRYVADEVALEKLGTIEARHPGPLVRDVLIEHLRERGVSADA